MIQSVSVTPVYNNGENLWGLKQITGFGIFIDCDSRDADEILNLVKEMLDREDSTESEKREDDD